MSKSTINNKHMTPWPEPNPNPLTVSRLCWRQSKQISLNYFHLWLYLIYTTDIYLPNRSIIQTRNKLLWVELTGGDPPLHVRVCILMVSATIRIIQLNYMSVILTPHPFHYDVSSPRQATRRSYNQLTAMNPNEPPWQTNCYPSCWDNIINTCSRLFPVNWL